MILFSAVLLWLATIFTFLASAKGKEMYDTGTLTLFWKIHCYPLLVVFVLLDFLFNTVFGTITYLELPRWDKKEWLFTWRTQRFCDKGSRMGLFWKR